MASIVRPGLIVLGIFLLVAGVVHAVRSPDGWPSVMENRKRVQQMERENDALRKKIEDMKRRNERLRSDQEARDEEVRRNTFKQKPGETTVILPPAAGEKQ
jgi:cell division protein FtsB